MASDPLDSNTFVILGPDEPDLEKMQSKIMSMLETGKSVNDIAISLRMDPESIQGFADRFNRTRWQSMSRNDMRNEHVMMLNEMAELGKLQYMSDPKPPHAFAVASLLKTAGEVFRDLEATDSFGDVRDRIQDEVIQAAMEQMVIALTKEIGQTRKVLVEALPADKRAEAARLMDDVARALGVCAKNAYDDSIKKLDTVFEENANKNKNGSSKKLKENNNGTVSLVPHVDPR